MSEKEEIFWDWLVKESTAAGDLCKVRGHCWHQGTSLDTDYCCKCGAYKSQRGVIYV